MSKFLMLDIGAGTMDVLYYDIDSGLHYKAVVKSPVMYYDPSQFRQSAVLGHKSY